MNAMKLRKTFFCLKYLTVLTIVWSNEAGSLSHIEPIHSHDELMIDLDAGWESRYFSEGRDALDGKSLWTGALSLGYNHFSGGVWYGRSSSHNYDELQYNLSLSEKTGDLSFYAGYTHLVFSKDDESDDEWSIGIAYEDLPYAIGTSIDSTYSMDAKGIFYEWSTYREFSLNDNSSMTLSATLGLNDDYVSDGHNGANFYALSVGIEKEILEDLSFFGHGMQSFAIDRDLSLMGDQQLKDFFHFGLGIQYNF